MDQARLDFRCLPVVAYALAFLFVMVLIAELSGVRIAYATFSGIGGITLFFSLLAEPSGLPPARVIDRIAA